MSLVGIALNTLSPDDMIKLIAEYGPAIEALIRFAEIHRDDRIRALSLNSITRGLHDASQTGDTTQLENAIRAHIGANGLNMP